MTELHLLSSEYVHTHAHINNSVIAVTCYLSTQLSSSQIALSQAVNLKQLEHVKNFKNKVLTLSNRRLRRFVEVFITQRTSHSFLVCISIDTITHSIYELLSILLSLSL